MVPKRRRTTRWICPSAEALEPRALLAGDVTATVVDGVLIIEGDNAGNELRVRSGENPGEFLVGGIPDSGTTVNMQTEPQRFSNVQGLAVALGDGDDAIALADMRVSGKVLIRTGADDDRVVLGRPDAPPPPNEAPAVAIRGELAINTGAGDDSVIAVDLAVARAFTVQGGQGDDAVRLGRPPMDPASDPRPGVRLAGPLSVALGDGANLVALSHLRLDGSLLVRTGSGADRVALDHVAVHKAMEIWTGAGQDDVSVQHSFAALAWLDTGADADRVALVDATFHALSVQLGTGDDVLAIKDTRVNRIARLDGGRGRDSLLDQGGNHFTTAVIVGFEPPNFSEVI